MGDNVMLALRDITVDGRALSPLVLAALALCRRMCAAVPCKRHKTSSRAPIIRLLAHASDTARTHYQPAEACGEDVGSLQSACLRPGEDCSAVLRSRSRTCLSQQRPASDVADTRCGTPTPWRSLRAVLRFARRPRVVQEARFPVSADILLHTTAAMGQAAHARGS